VLYRRIARAGFRRPPSTSGTENAELTLSDPRRPYRRQAKVLLPVLVLAAWASIYTTAMTRHALLESPDSAVYLGTANNIRDGHGPTVPFTHVWDRYPPRTALRFDRSVPSSHFPPGYPLALAAVSSATGNAEGAARVLDIVLVGVNVLLVGALTARMTAYRSVVVALIPPTLLLFYPDSRPFVFEGYGWLLSYRTVASEPLFYALFTGSLMATALALTGRDARRTLALSAAALLAGGALFTRYVGIAAVAATSLALICLDTSRSVGSRLRRASIFAALASAPTALFLGWSSVRGGGGARVIAYHPVPGTFSGIVNWFGRFLFPPSWPLATRTGALAAIVVVAVVSAFWLPPRISSAWRDDATAAVLVRLALIALAGYVVVVALTRYWFDRSVAVDPRILSPAREIFLALVVAVLYRALYPYARPVGAAVVLGLGCVLLIHSGWPVQRVWVDSGPVLAPTATPVERALSATPSNALLVSNAPDQAYLATRHVALAMPGTVDYLTGRPNRAFHRDVQELADTLRRRGGYVFWKQTLDPIVAPQQLAAPARLRLIAADGSEALYQVLPASFEPAGAHYSGKPGDA
jgi:hypothetical protein